MALTLVVGYDGSPQSRAAVDYPARRAGPDGQVYVVHAYAPPADWLGRSSFDRVERDHEERGRAVLDELVDDDLVDTNIHTELQADQPADAILGVAKTRGADEIVMGSRGHSGLRATFLGSVSQAVLAHAEVPVVVVPRS